MKHNPWKENPYYPVSEWQDEVQSDNTRLGYFDWVQHQMEGEDEYTTDHRLNFCD
jgi:hypothetical protein